MVDTEGSPSIQPDTHYVKIHHTILEKLATAPLTGGQLRCLLWLLRKTYGWNKKEDKISLSQWAQGTAMKRQNVWTILQSLLRHNIIYKISNGPRQAAAWGLNIYHETWRFDGHGGRTDFDPVMPVHDSPVVPQHDRSVIPVHDRSVIPPHERTKAKKESSSLLAAGEPPRPQTFDSSFQASPGRDKHRRRGSPTYDGHRGRTDDDDAVTLMRLAYEAVAKIGPFMQGEQGRSNLLLAASLIEQYGFDACHNALPLLKQRNYATLEKTRHGISAPLPYLRSLMESYDGHRGRTDYDGHRGRTDNVHTPAPVPTTLDFALEDLTP